MDLDLSCCIILYKEEIMEYIINACSGIKIDVKKGKSIFINIYV